MLGHLIHAGVMQLIHGSLPMSLIFYGFGIQGLFELAQLTPASPTSTEYSGTSTIQIVKYTYK